MIRKTQNGRKALALACATALCVSGIALPVQAADTTVSSQGDMNYVDMTQYTKVLLPTSSTMTFALDPQGLSTMTTDKVATKDLAAAAGNIVSNGEVSVVNYGYYPLKVTTSFYVTDAGKSTFVDNANDVDSDTTRKLYLTVTPSQTQTTVTTDDTDAITGTTGYTASGEELAITGTATTTAKGMVFALPGAEYEFTKTTDADTGKVTYAAERKADGTYGAAAFKIGGKINKNADWTSYTGTGKSVKTLKLNAVFSYETLANDAYTYLTDATDGFIQAGTYNMIQNNDPDLSELVDAGVILDASRGTSVNINLGTGIPATKVKTVTVVKHLTKTPNADASKASTSTTKTTVAGATANAAGNMLNIPALPAAIQTEIAKVDVTDSNCFDDATSTYQKISYEDTNNSYEATFGLIVALANGTTSEEIPMTFVKYEAPTVTYTGAALVKATAATANKAIAATTFSATFGNGGATKITKAVLNEAKTTATVSAVDNTKVTVPASGDSIAIAASAFKYVGTVGAPTVIVYTVTFDTGETADVEIPVVAS